MRIRVRSLVSLAILLGVLLPLALINARPAHAFVYVVNTPTDGISATHCSAADGQCSLRNAIDSANINPGADTIVFDQSVFTPGTTINVVTPLPYPDDPDGITIDGGANGVTIKNLANSGINFGLAFIGDTTVQNVTVKNITVQGFNYDGLQVCPQPNYSTGTCHGTTFNVNFDNVTTEFNAHDGIEVLGYEINSTNLDHVISAFNQHIGIDIDGGVSGGIDNPSITNSNSGFNTDGNIHLRGSGLYGLQMMDTVAQSSNHDGIFIDVHDVEGATLTRVDSENNTDSGIFFQSDHNLSNITVSDSKVINSGTGISIDSYDDASAVSGVSVHGNTVQNSNAGSGIKVSASGNGSTINDATIQNNNISGGAGINVDSDNGDISNVAMQGNSVTSGTGITILNSGGGGENTVSGNTVTGSVTHAGIRIQSPRITVTVSRNSTSANDKLGIDLETETRGKGVNLNDDGDADTGANGFLNYPVIGASDPQAVHGTACANCLVELFVADPDPTGYGEGKTFISDATADGAGNFAASICGTGLPGGSTYFTATATDSAGNTSEFSYIALLLSNAGACPSTPTPSPTATSATHTPTSAPTQTPAPTPTLAPGQHLQGDLTCDKHVNGLDALRALTFAVGITQPAGDGCPAVGSGTPKFGDVDCSGAVNEQDAVAILVFTANAAALPQHEPCTNIGAVLP